jgi:hypothetical protein
MARKSRVTMNPSEGPSGGGVSQDNHLVGPDPSAGKYNLIFGTSVMFERTLRQRFCPTGLPVEVR